MKKLVLLLIIIGVSAGSMAQKRQKQGLFKKKNLLEQLQSDTSSFRFPIHRCIFLFSKNIFRW